MEGRGERRRGEGGWEEQTDERVCSVSIWCFCGSYLTEMTRVKVCG